MRSRATPFHDLLTFSLAKKRQFGQPPLWIKNQAFKHFHVLLREAIDRGGLEQISVEFQRASESVTVILKSQGEIELGRTVALVEIQRRNCQVERADLGQRVVLKDEHHLE